MERRQTELLLAIAEGGQRHPHRDGAQDVGPPSRATPASRADLTRQLSETEHPVIRAHPETGELRITAADDVHVVISGAGFTVVTGDATACSRIDELIS